jgi:hypothetical protein
MARKSSKNGDREKHGQQRQADGHSPFAPCRAAAGNEDREGGGEESSSE